MKYVINKRVLCEECYKQGSAVWRVLYFINEGVLYEES